MKTRFLGLLVIDLLLLFSCENKNSLPKNVLMESMVMDKCMAPAPPPMAMAMAIEPEHYNPKLIKRGDLTISSLDIENTKTIIYDIVKSCKGYVTNEQLVANDPYSYYQISLNIQASNFDKFIHLLDSVKLNIISRSFSIEDVTMQYVDNSTRLENKKKLEKRYLELLSKTKDIKDMLEIEEKLENIRTDIEVKESQFKILEKQIAYSEFTLKISKTATNLTYSDKNKYSYKIGQGLEKGWEGIKSFVIFLFSIWPFYLIVVLIYFVIKKIRKNKKMKD